VKSLIIKKIGGEDMRGLPILLILVGESGSGKTTFAKMMDCDGNWFESSRAMVAELNKRGEPITHDTIHSFANKAYKENPCWQVPNILKNLYERDFLVYDGPRRIEEVEAILKAHRRVLVVRVAISSGSLRFGRLQKRDQINHEDFYRILRDEAGETELMRIISLSDLTIFNDGSEEEIKKQAQELKRILLSIDDPSYDQG